MSLSSHSVMDCSRVTQSFDCLWFYTNILTCRDGQVASFTDQGASQERFTVTKARDAPFLVNQQNEAENVESNKIPKCTKCGGVFTAFEAERVISKSNINSELLLKSGRERGKKGETRKRRKRNNCRPELHGMKVILGGLHLGFGVNGFLKFKESCGYDQMPAVQQQITKIPPLDVAMKEHLKLWAYAVACTVSIEAILKSGEHWQHWL